MSDSAPELPSSPTGEHRPPRVFISYRRESDAHRARIGALVEKLRGHGFDATWDEREWPFVTGSVTNWMRREVERADIVLMVFTEAYSQCYQGNAPEDSGMGAAFEGTVCALLLAKSLGHNKKFLPILIRHEDKAHLPPEIENIPFIVLDSEPAFDVLLKRLKAWLGVLPHPGPPVFAQSAVEAHRRPWHPPRPPDRFIGREEEVRELAAALIPGRRIAIVGAGGIGKTSLASVGLAANAESPEKPGPWTAGVFSHDYSVQPSHSAALAGLAAQLGGSEVPDAERPAFIRQRLDRPEALLYLEGCERAESLGHLLDLLPATTILLTSRDRQHALGAQPIELTAMPGGDAAQLLFHSACAGAQPWPPVDSAEWETVAARLGGHPLALRLAGQHLWLEKQTLADLRRIMDTAGFAGFDFHRTGKRNLGWLFDHSAAAVAAQHPGALGAWYLLSLHALAPLPLATIAASLGIGEDDARAHLRGLVVHSLVEVEPMPAEQIGQTEQGWRLAHALLAEWGRTELPKRGVDEPAIQSRWWDWWFAFSKKCFQARGVPGGPARTAAILPHFLAILHSIERHDGEDGTRLPLALAQVGLLQQRLGDLSAAEPLLRRAHALDERIHGPEHSATLNSLNNLACLLSDQGDLAGAEPLFRRAHETRQRVLGPEHRDTLTSLNNLAGILESRGDFAGAEPLYRRALADCERTLGADHPDTLGSANNLAGLLHSKGDVAEAGTIYRRTLQGRERVLGPEHPDTLISLNNLAFILHAQNDLAAAEPLFRRVFEIRERLLGLAHPDTLLSLNNLASVLNATGNPAAAEPLHRRALELRRRLLGDDHPDTLGSLNNLAFLLEGTGHFDEAGQLYRQALAANQRVRGPEHPETCNSAFNLAWFLADRGDLRAARPLAEQAVLGWTRCLPPGHPDVRKAQQLLQRISAAE